jgi:hypothetical protein
LIYFGIVALGGGMVIVFAIGQKVRWFKPVESDGFLRVIRNRIMNTFGGK